VEKTEREIWMTINSRQPDLPEILAVLNEELESTSSDLILLEDRRELGNTLIRCFEKLGVKKAVIFDGEVPGGGELRKKWQNGDKVSPRCELFFGGRTARFLDGVDACVTSCWSIVAEGGVCIMDSSSESGRLSSLLPPHHIIVSERSALVHRLEDVVDGIKTSRSSFVFISGPSRTADIEKQLVLGVHGPLSLTVIVLP
jgi:L-lactate utilization protein LutC